MRSGLWTAAVVVGLWAMGGTALAAGSPAWVTRGSAAFNSSGSRAFYGVGIASGIKNPALLRSTADNRARAELGKIFETFSASLMKDYMDSTGTQNVEQAVKTVSATMLSGVQIVDHYIESDGTMFALAMLDLDKVTAAIEEAKRNGVFKGHTKPVSVDDIFDKYGKKAEPQRPVATSGGDAGGQSAPKDAGKDTATAKGGKPLWIDGEDPRFPYVKLMCAVGYGPKRDSAESGAYAAIAKIFIVNVEQASQDYMAAYSKTGAPDLEVQSSATLTKTSTQKLLTGVRIPELWQDPANKTMFALSCIDRAKAAQTLRERIAELDGKVSKSIERAANTDAQGKLKELSTALDALVEREALNAELRIIDIDGVGIAGEYALYDVAAALQDVQDELKIGVAIDGPFAEDFRSLFVDALTSKGYKVEDTDDCSGCDAMVSALIRMEDGGAGTGSATAIQFARVVVNVDVKNLAQGKVIGSFKESRKEGHRNLEEAERKAVRELAKKLAPKVGSKLDATMKGKR